MVGSRWFLVAGLLASAGAHASSNPPVRESLDLTLVTLNRLSLEPVQERLPGLLPLKSRELPASVRPYLASTGQLDVLSGPVGKAAARIRRALAPGRAQKDVLRDSPRVVQAVGLWLDTHLLPGSDAGTPPAWPPSTDMRQAFPKVSALLKRGSADANGRALAAVCILRALKVPARVATARGGLVAQYWVPAKTAQLKAPRPKRRSKKSARAKALGPPLGWWACMDPGVQDAEIDAWSLDASSLAPLRWKPKQELGVSLQDWQRAAFAYGDGAAAHAAYKASLACGFLTGTAQCQSLSVAASALERNLTRGTADLWVLTAQHWRLQVEGAMAGMPSVQLLTPYRPALSSWGREQMGPVRALVMEAEGVFTDRPGALRLHKDLQDEWASPPPALGILHWYDVGVMGQGSRYFVQATRHDHSVDGVVLRADNLSPPQDWRVQVVDKGADGISLGATSARLAADGHFVVPLASDFDGASCLEVFGSPNKDSDEAISGVSLAEGTGKQLLLGKYR